MGTTHIENVCMCEKGKKMSVLPGDIQPHNRLIVFEDDQLELTIITMVAEMAFPAFSSGTELFYEMQYISKEVERMIQESAMGAYH